MSRFYFVLFLLGSLLPQLSAAVENAGHASESCKGCHEQQYQQWQQSHHYRSMQPANEDFVLGDFAGQRVSFHGVNYRFYRDNEKYWIDLEPEPGKIERYEIRYTFGFFPLQQYLLEIGNGHLQALNVAWDSRPQAEGGQRWFHLRPDINITPEHPFHWKRHFQNWNSRCADCHSTRLEKNYDPVEHSYQTTWTEVNVGCEACHGSGEKHIALAESGEISGTNSGFVKKISPPLSWHFKPDNPIAEPTGSKNDDYLNQCGSCHALRTQIDEYQSGLAFHDSNRLRLVSDETYFADGQVREEAFVVGSFLQSKMYSKGVTCGNCHDPHSGKTLAEGNTLCSQCHRPEVYDTADHHHHADGSEGAACVNCHMPQRNFMEVDARRDHSFTIPRPHLSAKAGVPNSCVSCHAADGKDNDWATEQLLEWGIEPNRNHWAYINQRAQIGDILVTRAMEKAVSDTALPAMVRASLLDQFSLMPSKVSVELARKQLHDPNPLVRRAAVSSLQAVSPQIRWQILSPHLQDGSRSVRFQLAEVLADLLNQLPAKERQPLESLIQEYRESMAFSADSPATQLAIASLELNLGDRDKALSAYRQALRIEPNFVPALLNLAEFYRASGSDEQSRSLYERALEVAPDSGAAQHSYGLYLIRQQQQDLALPYLKAAVAQSDAQPRFAFVYAVALDAQGQTETAIEVLTAAVNRWPNQYDMLMTLIHYLEKVGDINPIYQHLSALTAIAPASQDVRRLVQKYTSAPEQE